MTAAEAEAKKPDPGLFGPGMILFAASAAILAAGLSASHFGVVSQLVLSLMVSLGGWLLVFSALAFYQADPRAGKSDALHGAAIGAVTMGLLLAGWSTIGQTMASVISGAVVGAVFGVLIGRAARSLRSRLARKAGPEDMRDPANLRDPWIDP